MRISVILATYNAPAWLEKVLWGYSVQSCPPAEIVIADDGSTQDTLLVIERLKRATGLWIKHVWHEDRGFRKCEILNKAILAASSDYLAFSDGDCIPRRDFLEVHQRFAAPGRFLSGGLLRLPLRLSERIDRGDIVSGRAFSTSWLLRRGLKPSKKCLLIATPRRMGAAMDRVTPTKATWNGHNASGWKEDLLRVNGFDERMGYGGEDRELGERLMNVGVRPMQVRHRAVCVHLDHGRGYVDQQVIDWNIRHRESVRAQKITWTEHGIHKGTAADDDGMILPFPSVAAQKSRAA
jgi:glycosyltransferase involved in cell wall biosynthesis